MLKQIVVVVTMVVKAEDVESAETMVSDRLNEWFMQPPDKAPFPEGTLLHFRTEGREVAP